MKKFKPVAYIILGSSNSGKSFIYNKLFAGLYTMVNADNFYERSLKEHNLDLNQKNYSKEQLSLAAKLLSKSIKESQLLLDWMIDQEISFCYNTTGGNFKYIADLYNKLKNKGYKIVCIFNYVSPLESLKRNSLRDRSLKPTIVLRSYVDVNKNYLDYYNLFTINNDEFNKGFYVLNSGDLTPNNYSFNDILPYLNQAKTIKPNKTSDQILKSKNQFNDVINRSIILNQYFNTFVKFNTLNDIFI